MKKAIKKWVVKQLWQYVKKVIENDEPCVIGITGSVGKTTAKEAIVKVLEATGKPIVSSHQSFNTEFGIPLSMLKYQDAPIGLGWLGAVFKAWTRNSMGRKNYYLVLEYGTDAKGDMEFLTNRVKPDVAVFTTIAPAHLSQFGNLGSIAGEKILLAKSRNEKGYTIANHDDPYQKEKIQDDEKTVWYGINSKKAVVRASKVKLKSSGLKFELSLNKESAEVESQLIGKHQVNQLLIATAVGFSQKISFSKIVKILPTITSCPGRMNLVRGIRDITIIDDSYNSSPEAVKCALDTLAAYKNKRTFQKSRRLAILGNMNELGAQEKKFHLEIGKYLVGKCDSLIAVGPNAGVIAQGAKSTGMKAEKIITYESTSELLKRIDDVVQRGDTILIKASQNNMRFERVVKKLMLDVKKAGKILVRQSKYWRSH